MTTGTRVRLPGGVSLAVAPQAALARAAAVDRQSARAVATGQVAEYLAARTLLRGLLAEELGSEAETTLVAARPSGQPYLPAHPQLGISLSHSGGQVAAAVGVGVGVGVDVQVPVPASPEVLRRCCSPAVRTELAGLSRDVRDLEFAWIWTVQEACVKATGAGLAGRPWSIPVLPRQREGEWRGLRWRSLRADSAVPVSIAHLGDAPC
jgi:4'-phosphopantetheinyl transferase